MSVLRDLILKVDSTEKAEAEVKEALGLLIKLAEAKAAQFKGQIENSLTTGKMGDTLEVAITKVIEKKIEYRGLVENDMAGLGGKIASLLKPMFSGTGDQVTKIIDGVAGIVDDGMRAIMGAGQGNESDVETYAVTTEYPALVRFDFAFWGRNIAAESVRKHVESAFACVAYKSAVDIAKLDFNTFLGVYAPVLRRAFGADAATLKEMIKEARDIYDEFGQTKTTGKGFQLSPHDDALAAASIAVPWKITTRPARVGNF